SKRHSAHHRARQGGDGSDQRTGLRRDRKGLGGGDGGQLERGGGIDSPTAFDGSAAAFICGLQAVILSEGGLPCAFISTGNPSRRILVFGGSAGLSPAKTSLEEEGTQPRLSNAFHFHQRGI